MAATIHAINGKMLTPDDIHDAMVDCLLGLAETTYGDSDDAELILAARQPVSMASAFGDLCAVLGVVPPTHIRAALD